MIRRFWKRLTCRHTWVNLMTRYYPDQGWAITERCPKCDALRWRMYP